MTSAAYNTWLLKFSKKKNDVLQRFLLNPNTSEGYSDTWDYSQLIGGPEFKSTKKIKKVKLVKYNPPLQHVMEIKQTQPIPLSLKLDEEVKASYVSYSIALLAKRYRYNNKCNAMYVKDTSAFKLSDYKIMTLNFYITDEEVIDWMVKQNKKTIKETKEKVFNEAMCPTIQELLDWFEQKRIFIAITIKEERFHIIMKYYKWENSILEYTAGTNLGSAYNTAFMYAFSNLKKHLP